MLKSINIKKVLYLNVFSWGLLLNNGEKNTVVLNNRRHLLISHNKEIQLNSRRRLNRWRSTPPENHTIAPQPTTNHLSPLIYVTFQKTRLPILSH